MSPQLRIDIAALFGIVLNLAVSFGLHLSAEQVSMMNAAVLAGLLLFVHGVRGALDK